MDRVYREIGEVLGRSVSMVKKHITSALTQLKILPGEEGIQ